MKIDSIKDKVNERLGKINRAASKILEMSDAMYSAGELQTNILNGIIDVCRIVSNNAYRLDRLLEAIEDSPEEKENANEEK